VRDLYKTYTNLRFARGASYKSLAGQRLQQFDEHAPVPQVQVEVGDAAADPGQDGVDPLGECLLLNSLALI